MNQIEFTFNCGKELEIGQFNIIGDNVVVGDNVKIGNHCVIEDNVIIGNDVILQGSVKIASGTVIENGCILKHGTILTNKVLLKRNVFMGPNTITLGGTHERKSLHGTVIGENCYIGGGTQIVAAAKICDNVTLGAMSFVNKDITEPGVYVGIPARKLR
jgi:UDP-2-acetamido-3-amino-2,3-dideoxy-glucuronate N-acetyltransferase